MLDQHDFFRDFAGDEHGLASHDDFGCRDDGCGIACMALVAEYPLRGGCPASMVIRTS